MKTNMKTKVYIDCRESIETAKNKNGFAFAIPTKARTVKGIIKAIRKGTDFCDDVDDEELAEWLLDPRRPGDIEIYENGVAFFVL